MFEKFTDRARQVVIASKDTALARGDQSIGAAHLLFALAVTEGVASRVLAGLGVDAATAERALGPAASAGSAGADGPAGSPGGGEPVADIDPDAEALLAIGIDLDEIRRKAEESFGEGALDRVRPSAPRGTAARRAGRLSPMDSDVRQALALSLDAARGLHHRYIGTEHLLLGLAGAGQRPGSAVPGLLRGLGLDAAQVHACVLAELARRGS